MREMITFQRGPVKFTLRVVAVVLHHDAVLVHRAAPDDFWALPGGRAELLESAEETLVREMREELGVAAHVERLLWVVENFFTFRGRPRHELGLYFLVTFPPDSPIYRQVGPFDGEEEGVRLIFEWQPLDALAGFRLYPTFLRSRLRSLPSGIEHIVHTDPVHPRPL